MRRRARLVPVLVCGITACGGHQAHVRPDPGAVAAKFGCVNYQPAAASDGPIELFAATEGTCSYRGGTVTVLTFTSSHAQQQWESAARASGDGSVVTGRLFAVETNGVNDAATVAAAVGGSTF